MQADLDVNLGSTGGPGGIELDFTPLWVPSTVEFDGKEWYQVGIRYKGNSTLLNAERSNTDKYPFKLDFDEFEDTYPAIENQRFFGFKQLNLSSNNMGWFVYERKGRSRSLQSLWSASTAYFLLCGLPRSWKWPNLYWLVHPGRRSR